MRAIVAAIDQAITQLVAETFFDGPLPNTRTICQEIVVPTLNLWKGLSSNPAAQIEVGTLMSISR